MLVYVTTCCSFVVDRDLLYYITLTYLPNNSNAVNVCSNAFIKMFYKRERKLHTPNIFIFEKIFLCYSNKTARHFETVDVDMKYENFSKL